MLFQLSLFIVKIIVSQLALGLNTSLFSKNLLRSTQWTFQSCRNRYPETFHRVFTAVDRDRITSRLIYDNKIFCTTLFWCLLKRSSVKRNKPLVICLNASWNSFYVNLPFERLAFNTNNSDILIRIRSNNGSCEEVYRCPNGHRVYLVPG